MAEVAQQGEIFIDTEEGAQDSAVGTEIAESTQSLASFVQDYQFENGRRYHALNSGVYLYPNDEVESTREVCKHYAIRLLHDGRLQDTKFESDPAKVLDLGTGTGTWAIEFADEHLASHVIGVDLSPIQPTWVPSNVEFQVDDIESEGWTFQDQDYDYIHVRFMANAVRDWPKLLQRCKTSLKPGAKIEVSDFDFVHHSDDGTVTPENLLLNFLAQLVETVAKVGVDLRVTLKVKEMLTEAGFTNVREDWRKLPMGPWPKDPQLKQVGRYHRAQFSEALSGIAMGSFTRLLKWSPEQVEAHVALLRQSLFDKDIHAYWKRYGTFVPL